MGTWQQRRATQAQDRSCHPHAMRLASHRGRPETPTLGLAPTPLSLCRFASNSNLARPALLTCDSRFARVGHQLRSRIRSGEFLAAGRMRARGRIG